MLFSRSQDGEGGGYLYGDEDDQDQDINAETLK